MKRWKRRLLRTIGALFLLALIVPVLDVWEGIRRQYVMMTNPFALARQNKSDWPAKNGQDKFSPELEDAAARDQYRGAGQSKSLLPVPSDRETALHRVAYLGLLEDWERYAFTDAYRVKLVLVDGRGTVVKAYSESDYPGGKTPSDYVGAKDAPRIIAALPYVAEDGPPIFFDRADGPPWYCMAASTNPPPIIGETRPVPPYAALCWPNMNAPAPDLKDLWDRDFFSFRPHERRDARPNVLGVSEQFSVNNVGLRDDDVVLPKPPGVYRILCVGASTTEEGPSNDLTYPNILECLANKKFGGRHIDVINAGVSGMNSVKHKLKLSDYLALQPDLIVTYLAVNDICHDLFRMWVKDAAPWQKCLRASRFINNHFNQWLLPDERKMAEDIRGAKMSTIRFIIGQARDAGVETVLCTFAAPDPEKLDRVGRDYMDCYTQLEWGGRYVTFDSYLRALALFNRETVALGRETGVPVIDIAGQTHGGTDVFGDICHMKNCGIEAKARLVLDGLSPLIEDRLRRRGLLP